MKFGVLGAGAIGGWLGGRLAHAGEDVTLIARGPHLEAMRTKGVTILEPDGLELVVRPRCSDDLKLLGSADVVFVTVKAHSLPGLARDLGNAVSPEAALVFVQAFAVAARAYVLEQGRIVAEGSPSELAQDARIREAYLGQQ